MKEIFDFLSNLANNNNKEWFDINRDTYQKTRQQFIHLTEIFINEIRSFDPEIPFLDPKKCVFRIFKDVRFSKDKTPYKNNYGTFIASDGRKGGNPGYYFHIQPGESFMGGGVYMPEADKLKSIRTEIYNHTEDYIELISAPEFKEKFQLFSDDKLKTAPRGFPKDFEHIDLLRYKSFAPFMRINDEQLFDPNLIETIISNFKLLTPFNHFLNHAIGQHK